MVSTKTIMTQKEKALKIREWLESDSYEPLTLPGFFHGERMFVRVPATKWRRFDYVYYPKSVDGTETGVSFKHAEFLPALIWDNAEKAAFSINATNLGISPSAVKAVLGTCNNPRLDASMEELEAILDEKITNAVLMDEVPEVFSPFLRMGFPSDITQFVMYDEYTTWFDDVIVTDISRLVKSTMRDNDNDILRAVESPSEYAEDRAAELAKDSGYGVILSRAVAVHRFFSAVLNDENDAYPRDLALTARSMHSALSELPDNGDNIRVTLKDEAGGGSHLYPVKYLKETVLNAQSLVWEDKPNAKLTDVHAVTTVRYGPETLWEAADSENEN